MTCSFTKTIMIKQVKLNCFQERQFHDYLPKLQAMAYLQNKLGT